MTPQQFIGRIYKVLPTRTFKTGSASREFWVEEVIPNQKKDPKFRNILKFEVFTSSKGPSEHYAGVEDLDNFKPGVLVKFSFSVKGNLWNKDGKEMCFNKLAVESKIDILSRGDRQQSAPEPADPDDFSDSDDGGSMPF